jgi:uncharacterized protein (TIGR00369 family)
MGFTLAKATRGRVRLQMKVDARHLQVHGVVHGGVLAALADTAGGLASYMACPLGTRVATVEMKINYLEGVERGTVTADAEVVRIGRHLAVVDCDVTDDTKRLVAKALMTFFVGPFAEPSRQNSYSSSCRPLPPWPLDPCPFAPLDAPFDPPCAASSPSL